MTGYAIVFVFFILHCSAGLACAGGSGGNDDDGLQQSLPNAKLDLENLRQRGITKSVFQLIPPVHGLQITVVSQPTDMARRFPRGHAPTSPHRQIFTPADL